MNVNIFIFSVCSRSYITSFGHFCKYAVLANMSRGDWLIYTTIVKRSTWIMCNILPSLRCIAVRFLPFSLHAPDSRYAHKQNADERQTHIGIRSGAKCPTHRQGRPATSFSDGQSAENEKFHPHFSYSPAGSRPADRRTKKALSQPVSVPVAQDRDYVRPGRLPTDV